MSGKYRLHLKFFVAFILIIANILIVFPKKIFASDTSDKNNVLIYANKNGTARGYDLLWKKANITGTYYEESVVAYKDGVVYLISTAVGNTYPGNRDIFALDATTGEIIDQETIGPSFGSPVIDGNTLYIGTADESWYPDTGWGGGFGLYSFDISNIRTTGFSLNWFHSDAAKVAMPAVFDSNLVYYIEFEGDKIVALNKNDGSVNWTFTKGNRGAFYLTLIDNAIYFANSYYGGKTLYKINATNGTQVWAKTISNYAWDNSIAYDGNGSLYFAISYGHTAASYDLNGNLRWEKALGCKSLSTTAYHNNVVFFSDTCGYIHALNPANGNDIWGPVHIGGTGGQTDIGAVTITGGLIFIGTRGATDPADSRGMGRFYILDELTGDVLWQYHEPDLGNIMSPASIANGVFFNGTSYWDVYAFDVGDGNSDWLIPRYDTNNSGYSPNSLTTSKYVNSSCSNSSDTTTCDINNLYTGRAIETRLEMENETVESVTLDNGNFHIYVDGGNIYLPAISSQSNLNNLTIKSGATSSYSTSIPRLTNVSPSSANVLTSSYNPNSKEVQLSFDNANSITATIESHRQPFLNITSTISSTGSTSISATGLSGTSNINSVPMEISFSSGSVDVSINSWNYSKKSWSENSSNIGSLSTTHTMMGLEGNGDYIISVNGVRGQNISGSSCVDGICRADANGEFTFIYSGGYSTVDFELDKKESSSSGSVSSVGNQGTSAPVQSKDINQTSNTKPSLYVFTKTLKQKSRGQEVLNLQTFLFDNKYLINKKELDSIFGPKTKQALMNFQKKYGLKPDGILGPKTKKVINEIK